MIALTAGFSAALGALLARLALATLRLVPLTLALPVLGGRLAPATTRVPILVVLAIGTCPTLLTSDFPVPPSTQLVSVVVHELMLGVVLALVLATPFFALEQAGAMLDAARGANAAEVLAPDTGARSSPLAELARQTFGVVFLASGGLRAVMSVLAEAAVTYPPGTVSAPLPNALPLALRFTAHALEATVGVLAAGLLALVAAEFALGFSSRFSPPLAQSQLAVPVRLLVPLGVLALSVSLWTNGAQSLAREALGAARSFVAAPRAAR